MKKRIFIPGPVELEQDVLLEMSRQIVGHRTKEFEENVLLPCIKELKEIYNTKNDVFIITGSGTAAMEAAVASTIKEGDEYITIKGGKFGERFSELVNAFGGRALDIEVEWGKAVNPEEVEKVAKNSSAKAITLTHNETSTGVLHDAKAIGKIAREYDMLFIVDAITSFAGDYVLADEWGIDICAAGSQKCLGAPPGLAFAGVSEKAWKVIDSNSPRSYYLNLALYRDAMKKSTTPYTPSVSLIFALKKALDKIKGEGLENRIKRHRRIAKAAREGAKGMNLSLFADEAHASNTVTAVNIPKNLTDEDVRGRLKKEFGISLAEGQDKAKGKIFRIGHMGAFDEFDLFGVLSALEVVLKKANHDFKPGSGVAAAEEVILHSN